MAKIGLPKGSGKWSKVREKSVKSQGILKRILSGNPERAFIFFTSPITKGWLIETKMLINYLALKSNELPMSDCSNLKGL